MHSKCYPPVEAFSQDSHSNLSPAALRRPDSVSPFACGLHDSVSLTSSNSKLGVFQIRLAPACNLLDILHPSDKHIRKLPSLWCFRKFALRCGGLVEMVTFYIANVLPACRHALCASNIVGHMHLKDIPQGRSFPNTSGAFKMRYLPVSVPQSCT